MKQLRIKIIENKKIVPGFYKMILGSPYLAKRAEPGQFLEVKCSDEGGPLLRRPFGVHRILKSGVEILYEVVGEGTELLSKREKGGYIDVIGPLGNGFSISSNKRPAILIAGGVGAAPLLALAEKIAVKRAGSYVIIGAKNAAGILCEKEFKNAGCFVMRSTEDGSRGHKGYATDILAHLLKTINCQSSTVYACGPHPMLKAVSHIARLAGIACQISLEERMACGVGACLGCPVKVRTAFSAQRPVSTQYAVRSTQYEYKMVCKDGPVFNAEEIAW